MRKKIAIIFGQPSPYRVDFISYLEKNYPQYEFRFFYGKRTNARSWDIDFSQLIKPTEVELGIVILKRKFDNRTIIYSSKIKEHLDKFVPDVIVASEYNSMAQGAMKWAKKNNKYFISWTDGTAYSERNISIIQKLLRKKIVKKADGFIASSSKSRELQISYGAPKDQIFISLLTVNTEKYKVEHSEPQKISLIYVGSLIERKGVDLLLRAVSKIDSADFVLNIVGDGCEKENLRLLAKQLKIEDKINFCGFVATEQMKDVYASNSIFVLPTREDCFGLVILEAMCAGLPVVISKYADGAQDLIENNYNGIIIDPQDTILFAKKLEQLILDENLRKIMGNNSKSKVEDFSFSKVSEPFIQAIESVL